MEDDPLIPVPIPPLITILLDQERAKGSPLTQDEVLEIRNKCVCMMMRSSHAREMADSRGYDDLNPEHIWEQWQDIREELHASGEQDEPKQP